MLKTIGGAALVAVAAPTLAVATAAVALPIIGFGAGGVAAGTSSLSLDAVCCKDLVELIIDAGSIAAGIQSVFYGGATCGVFSVLQSVGATIAAPAIGSVVAAATTATVGGRLIADAGREGDGDGRPDDTQAGAQGRSEDVVCQCVGCVCDDDCDCACKRQRRRQSRQVEPAISIDLHHLE